MTGYADLPGVRMWYDERGSGEPLLLLHGGLADARFFRQNVGGLAERFRVFAIDFRGHGHTADVEGPITFGLMAEDAIAFLEAVVGRPAHLVGHSNGAFVALLVALRRPLPRMWLNASCDEFGGLPRAWYLRLDASRGASASVLRRGG